MGLLDTLLAAVTGKSDAADANPLGAALNSLLAQNGGIQGLMAKFSQGGLGEVFSSWVGMGDNKSISPDQISKLLGSDQVKSLASSLGVDPVTRLRLPRRLSTEDRGQADPLRPGGRGCG